MFGAVTGTIELVLFVLFIGLKGFAFFDCLRWRKEAFPAVGRQSKLLWVLLTGISLLTAFITSPTGIFGLAGAVIALIYLFDVRPRIKEILGR